MQTCSRHVHGSLKVLRSGACGAKVEQVVVEQKWGLMVPDHVLVTWRGEYIGSNMAISVPKMINQRLWITNL